MENTNHIMPEYVKGETVEPEESPPVIVDDKTAELLDEIQDLKVLIKALTKALTENQNGEV